MLAAVIISVFLIAGLVAYAMHRNKPTRLKLSASLLKLLSFSIEVEAEDRGPQLPPADPPGGTPR